MALGDPSRHKPTERPSYADSQERSASGDDSNRQKNLTGNLTTSAEEGLCHLLNLGLGEALGPELVEGRAGCDVPASALRARPRRTGVLGVTPRSPSQRAPRPRRGPALDCGHARP
jgi:hypothetical protein